MKKLCFIALYCFCMSNANAQVHTYATTGIEIKLMGVLLDDTQNPSQIPRATFWFNFTENFHFDVAKSFGFFVGGGVENIGYVADYNDLQGTKIKYRSYCATVPLGFKVGNFDGKKPNFFFAGGAVSVPFHFKEKIFYNDKKVDVFKEWFGRRVNFFLPSAFCGITFSNRTSLKFQYYFEDFMNRSFMDNINGLELHPYSHVIHSNIIAVTFGGSFTGVKKKT